MKTIDLDNLFRAEDFQSKLNPEYRYSSVECAIFANARFREIVKERGIKVYRGENGNWCQIQSQSREEPWPHNTHEGVLFVTKELTSDTKSREVQHHPV